MLDVSHKTPEGVLCNSEIMPADVTKPGNAGCHALAPTRYAPVHKKSCPISVWATLWITLGTSRQIRASTGFPHDASFFSRCGSQKIQIRMFYE